MRLELVSVLSSDQLELPGLLYTPEHDTKQAVVWLHGMGDNAVFYKPKAINALATALTDKGIALLAFNNRGAHAQKKIKVADESLPEEERSYLGGMHYELIADCVHDIDGAAAFLAERSFSTLYLVGLSTGANKICAYHARAKHNPFSKYVLAGPGDDTGLMFIGLGEKKFWQALRYAAQFAEADPQHVMPKYTGMYPFSAGSAWDILNPDGDYNTFPFYEASQQRLGKKPLFEEYRQLDRPTLVIYGAEDEYTSHVGGVAEAVKLFMGHTSNTMLKETDFIAIPDTGHSFGGAEKIFALQVADWLAYG